jgi:hypothetical protein
MEERHENSLNDLLEQVAFEGYVSVPKWRIPRWYGSVNFAVGTRNDLRKRWKSLNKSLGKKNIPVLRMAEIGGNIVLMRATDFFPDEE